MCGLTGFIDFSGNSSREILEKMTACLAHRGPDDDGFKIINTHNATLGLGFRRLSIIDLSPAGHQPMQNENTGDIILFNGEIYNFAEIKLELIHAGLKFKSHSDTEVILKAFENWGANCVHRFIGMFAIVIYNPSANKFYFYRDRAGVKPLIYYWDGSLFLFASEIKSFHQHPEFKKEINFDALSLYFHHGYIPHPYSIFKNVCKLSPGNRMELDLNTKAISIHEYWNVIDHFNKPKLKISFDEASMELEKLLISACKYRMVADVPVGVFLSGGYDSSCVTALLQENSSIKLKTFTIGFENPKYNEAPFAKKVSEFLGTDHNEFLCTEKEAQEIIPLLPEIYDEPFSDGGAIPNILVCKKAKNYVKAVISADGGDEVFAGYIKHYHSIKQVDRYKQIPTDVKIIMSEIIGVINNIRPHKLYEIDRLQRLQSFLKSKNTMQLFDLVNRVFSSQDINAFMKLRKKALNTPFKNDHLLNENNDEVARMIAVDFQTYLVDDILQKVDRATMSTSIEGREPLLDHRIVEFAASLPSSYKLRNATGKYIFRDVVHRYIPKEIMDRPKMGFGLPISIWGLKDLRPLFEEFFDVMFLEKQKIFSVKKVRELYDFYMAGNQIAFDKVWTIFIFQQWYKKWMM